MSNQGDILSYNPDLSIYSAPVSGVTLDDSYTVLDNFLSNVDLSSNKSNTALEFEMHSPSKKVSNLVNVIEKAKMLHAGIEDDLSSSVYGGNYLSSKDEVEVANILAENAKDVEFGSTNLEVYSILEKLISEMNDILTLYIECIFGKDVDTDSVASIESEYIDKIEKYETEQKYEKVNYFNLYYDTQISYLLGEYSDTVYKYVYNLGTMKENSTSFVPDKTSSKIIQASFEKIDTLLKSDIVKDSTVSDDITTALNNIFLAKQEVNLYLDTFASIYTMGGVSADFLEMKQENIDELERKLDNLVKTVMYSSISKGDITDTLKKKSKYRSFFVA